MCTRSERNTVRQSEYNALNVRSSHSCFENRCFLKFRNILRKTPVAESLFNKVAGLQPCNFIKYRLQHRCFLVNIAKIL